MGQVVPEVLHWALTRMSDVDLAQLFNSLSRPALELVAKAAVRSLEQRRELEECYGAHFGLGPLPPAGELKDFP